MRTRALREFFDLTGAFNVSDALPYLRWLDLDGAEKKMKKTAKELDGFVQVWLEEHKSKRNSEWKKSECLRVGRSNLDLVVFGG